MKTKIATIFNIGSAHLFYCWKNICCQVISKLNIWEHEKYTLLWQLSEAWSVHNSSKLLKGQIKIFFWVKKKMMQLTFSTVWSQRVCTRSNKRHYEIYTEGEGRRIRVKRLFNVRYEQFDNKATSSPTLAIQGSIKPKPEAGPVLSSLH